MIDLNPLEEDIATEGMIHSVQMCYCQENDFWMTVELSMNQMLCVCTRTLLDDADQCDCKAHEDCLLHSTVTERLIRTDTVRCKLWIGTFSHQIAAQMAAVLV